MDNDIKAMFADDDGRPIKMQEHKPRLSLIPVELMNNLARVYEYGLIKYERDSWRGFTPQQADDCLIDAAIRHLMSYAGGEEYDAESGLHHLDCAAWNCQTIRIVKHGKE